MILKKHYGTILYNREEKNKISAQLQLFLETGGVEYDSVRKVVLDSWIRSKKLNLDSNSTTVHSVSKKEYNKRVEKKKYLLEIAVPYMKKIFDFIQEQGGIAALSDEDGVILEAFGDYDSFDIPMAPYHGTCWLEKYVGTNGIGTALHEDKAVQIWASEYYMKGLQMWTSCSDTIHDLDGNIIGCFTLISSWYRANYFILGLVAATAGAIERQLIIEKSLKEKTAVVKEQKAIMELINEGIIVIDNKEIITSINNQACMILGVKSRDIIGSPIYDIIISGIDFSKIIEEGINIFDSEVSLKLATKIFNGNISFAKLINDNNKTDGLVITIKEMKKVHNLVNRVIGSKAYFTFNDIIGNSDTLNKAIKFARSASKSNSNVLLLGKSGTGKELFAQSIHNAGNRRGSSFVAVNCGALPRNLVETELFGYEGGAYTGSKREGHPGKFELADGGTIFLDEIGEMPIEAQVNLLRVLENREVVRVGGKYPKKIDVRVIAATNRDLLQQVQENSFREDLFYRLNVLTVNIPALHERNGDIRMLVDYFTRKISVSLGKTISSLSEEAYTMLENYNWPGNVRELENVIERAVNIAETNQLEIDNLPNNLKIGIKKDDFIKPAKDSLKSKEYEQLIKILKETNGNLRQTALKLGIARSTLYLKMKKSKIASEDYRTI